MIALKNILVPTDFGSLAKIALRYAKELARNFCAEVHVLHVMEEEPALMPSMWTGLEGTVLPGYSFTEGPLPRIHADLEKLMADAEYEQVHARLAIRRGTALTEILRYAKAHDIDVIVIGTPEKGVITHLLRGPSVAEQVIRKAPCPVLTVRQSEHEFVMA
jgi:nucleotide-binding universal stress UspA family protein